MRSVVMLTLASALISCSGSSDTDVNDELASSPSAPGRLEATVYSSTDAELTWEASLDDGWVMGYEVRRDNELVGPLLDALSYYDPELEPDTSYHYSIVAVDDQGNHSTAAGVSLHTPTGPPLSTINRANHVRLLAEVFDVFSGTRYEAPLLGLEALALDEDIGTATLEGRYWLKSYDCDNHAQATSRRRDDYPGFTRLSMHFEQCVLNGVVYDGNVDINGLRFETENLRIRAASDEALHISGSATRQLGSLEPFGAIPSWQLVDVTMNIDTSDGLIHVSNANTWFGAGLRHAESTRFTASLSGSFTLQSPLTDDMELIVTTPETLITERLDVPFTAYRNERDWFFDTGTLQLSAADGSTLTMTPVTEKPDMVEITIAQGDHSVSFQKPWSLWADTLELPPVTQEEPFMIELPAASPVIRSDNAETLITAAFDVLTGTRYWPWLHSVPLRWENTEDVDRAEGLLFTAKTCDNGGTASTRFTLNGGYIEFASARYLDCVFNSDSIDPPYTVEDIRGVAYDGAVQGWTSVGGHSIISDDLALTRYPDIDLQFSGWLQQSYSFTRNDSYRLRRTDELSMQAVDVDGTVLDLSHATLYRGAGMLGWNLQFGFRADLAGTAVFSSPITDNRRIRINTPTAFRYFSTSPVYDWTFPTGRLQLLADDGSSLLLDADAGMPGSVRITVDNRDGSTQFDADWAIWAGALRLWEQR